MRRLSLLGITLISLLMPTAFADEGDWLVRIRAVNVAPQVDSSPIRPAFPTGGVDVENDIVPELDVTYFFTKNWAVEFSFGTTQHDIKGANALSPLGKVADVRTLAPTPVLQYHFAPDAKVRPYVGVGLNYTTFFDAQASAALNGALGPTKIDLEDSIGYALQTGIDYAINDKWSMNFDVKYIDMNTTAELKTGPVVNKVDIDLNPFIVGVGIGRKF